MAKTILENPHFSKKVGLLARRNGKYTRPIVGELVDMRVEDFLPNEILKSRAASNIIAKLPDIAEIGQIEQYLICTANAVSRVDLTKEEAIKYLNSGVYILLPHDHQNPLWEYSKSPWWEYTMVIDENNGYVKAPKIPRSGEPTAEEIDEQLDTYKSNIGKITVTSPQSLKKQITTESYISRLSRL